MRPVRATRRGAAAAALVVALLLAGCTSDTGGLLDDYGQNPDDGYTSADGAVTTIPPAKRGEPAVFGGTTDTGTTVDSSELHGEVVVLNFWYASCPPCRLEAPDLEELHQRFADADVTFLGVNTEDTAPTSLAFADEHGVTYPSILDAASNDVLLAFAGQVAPNAVPTTLILDREGRVAARFSGMITDPGLVATIVDDTLAEAS